jgi:hypothetical protein
MKKGRWGEVTIWEALGRYTVQCTCTGSRGRKLRAPLFFSVVFIRVPHPLSHLNYHGQSGSLSLFSLTLSSLCVAGRAYLSQLTGGGGAGRT